MRLTINQFKECLIHPATHLSTMADCEIIYDKKKSPVVWRTTNFAETEVYKDGKRYILGMPLTEEAHVHCLRKVTLMKRFNSPYLTHSEILIDEMSIVNRAGEVLKCDLLMHEIPNGGTLYDFAEYASRTKLLAALDNLEAEFKRLRLVHGNLTPHNVIVGENYDIYAIRYHYTEIEDEEGECYKEFASLREWINTKVDIDMDSETEGQNVAPNKLSASLFSGYTHVGNPFEEMVCVADDQGYLYVNYDNKIIIDGRFKWAGDFHEGRAEVETETGMGLIDKCGRFIIEPKYKIVDYNVDYGLSRVRLGDKWALFNYMGEMILPFEQRYIDEEDLELLSI